MKKKDKPKKPALNEALRLARLYWGYTQAELAEHLHVSQSMISSVEAGNKGVSMELLSKYSIGLKLRMSDLLFFAEELEGQPVASRGKLIVANKVLELLDALSPREKEKTADRGR